jgi:hypothetical protein
MRHRYTNNWIKSEIAMTRNYRKQGDVCLDDNFKGGFEPHGRGGGI